MIVDASILVALLREEPETAWIEPILNANYGTLKMSVANYLEAAIVIDANDDEVLSERLELVIAHFGIELIPVNTYHARIGREAFNRYGKGRHRAHLNYGDCFAYALARGTNEPLLFKGDDFNHTDITLAR